MIFDLDAAINGAPITTRNGTVMKFVAYEPAARQPLVLLDVERGEIETYYDDGIYFNDREECCLDVFTQKEPT